MGLSLHAYAVVPHPIPATPVNACRIVCCVAWRLEPPLAARHVGGRLGAFCSLFLITCLAGCGLILFVENKCTAEFFCRGSSRTSRLSSMPASGYPTAPAQTTQGTKATITSQPPPVTTHLAQSTIHPAHHPSSAPSIQHSPQSTQHSFHQAPSTIHHPVRRSQVWQMNSW